MNLSIMFRGQKNMKDNITRSLAKDVYNLIEGMKVNLIKLLEVCDKVPNASCRQEMQKKMRERSCKYGVRQLEKIPRR